MNKKEDNLERINELARMAEEIHNVNPRYVLVTATRAIPSSIALKSALKEAYPNEKQPYFLFVDPRALKAKEKGSTEFERRIKIDKFIREHSRNLEKEKILIYDETYGKVGEAKPEKYALGESGRTVRESLTNPGRVWREFDVKSYIKKYGDESVWNLDGNGAVMAFDENIYQRYGPKSLGFTREKHGKEGLGIISEFKKLGVEAGNILKAHQKRNLENKVSLIAISSLILSIFLISSNFTANVIGNNISSTSNWAGGIFFIIALIGAFFYFKSRRTKK